MVDARRESERDEFVPAEADDLWSSRDNKGWNRLSITRRNVAPTLRPEDLLLPSGLGNLRMLLSCSGMGLLATILYVWVPLMLVEFFVPIGGTLFSAILVAAFITLSLGLYFWGTIETQRDRDLAGRL
jgi:TM2 domain-containing membrane protein YozV